MTPSETGPLRSRLYECRVIHERLEPKRRRFVHRIFMLGVDLAELPRLDRVSPLFSVNAPNLFSLRESDYFPVAEPLHNPSADATGRPAIFAAPSLASRVTAWLGAHGIDLAGGRIELVAMPRIAGHLFNPVSFFFCYDASGRPAAAIAEVTNTFREVKHYLLGPSTWRDGAFRRRVTKHFYVSPFSDVDVAFGFELHPPNGHLTVRIDDFAEGRRTLASTLAGPARSFSAGTLAWFAVKYPFLTVAVLAFIHLHALALWLARVPWFPKAARAADQRDLHRPHASIARRPSTSTTH
jgi:hypothetical protein